MRIKLLLLTSLLAATVSSLPSQTTYSATLVQEPYQNDSLGTGVLFEIELPDLPPQKGPYYLEAWRVVQGNSYELYGYYGQNYDSQKGNDNYKFPKMQKQEGMGGLLSAFANFAALPGRVIGGIAKNYSQPPKNANPATPIGDSYLLQVVFPLTGGANYEPLYGSISLDSLPGDRKFRLLVPYLAMVDGENLHFGIRQTLTGPVQREWITPKLQRQKFHQTIATPVVSIDEATAEDAEGYLVTFRYKFPLLVSNETLEPRLDLDGGREIPLITKNPGKLSANDTVLRAFIPSALTLPNSYVQFHATLPYKAAFHGQEITLPKGRRPNQFQIELISCRITPALYAGEAEVAEHKIYADASGQQLPDEMTMANEPHKNKLFQPNHGKSSITVPLMPKDHLHLHFQHGGEASRHLMIDLPASLLSQEEIVLEKEMFKTTSFVKHFKLKVNIRVDGGEAHPVTIIYK